jgi:tRNA-specific 2-thiouridylase
VLHGQQKGKKTVKVAVAMSGGVDSSVAAALIKERGHDVTGVTMMIWGGETSPEKKRHGCYGPEEINNREDARKVARSLGIPFYDFDLTADYREYVLEYFRQEYQAGRTPNPCLRCNCRVKLGALITKAKESGIEFDYFATGHYARVEYDEIRRRHLLKKAKDLRKDQTYFVASLSQEQLSRLMFPIGDYTKEEVRKIAAGYNLKTSRKPESQDFIAGGYLSILDPTPPGPIIDRERNVLGQHRGITSYTVGQRKGLGIHTRKPLYVTEIDAENNTIVVGSMDESFRDEFTASDLNWIAIDRLEQPLEVNIKIRNAHRESGAVMTPLDNDRVRVKFDKPQRAITPGQAAVFYLEDIVVGCGTIEKKGE